MGKWHVKHIDDTSDTAFLHTGQINVLDTPKLLNLLTPWMLGGVCIVGCEFAEPAACSSGTPRAPGSEWRRA